MNKDFAQLIDAHFYCEKHVHDDYTLIESSADAIRWLLNATLRYRHHCCVRLFLCFFPFSVHRMSCHAIQCSTACHSVKYSVNFCSRSLSLGMWNLLLRWHWMKRYQCLYRVCVCVCTTLFRLLYCCCFTTNSFNLISNIFGSHAQTHHKTLTPRMTTHTKYTR